MMTALDQRTQALDERVREVKRASDGLETQLSQALEQRTQALDERVREVKRAGDVLETQLSELAAGK